MSDGTLLSGQGIHTSQSTVPIGAGALAAAHTDTHAQGAGAAASTSCETTSPPLSSQALEQAGEETHEGECDGAAGEAGSGLGHGVSGLTPTASAGAEMISVALATGQGEGANDAEEGDDTGQDLQEPPDTVVVESVESKEEEAEAAEGGKSIRNSDSRKSRGERQGAVQDNEDGDTSETYEDTDLDDALLNRQPTTFLHVEIWSVTVLSVFISGCFIFFIWRMRTKRGVDHVIAANRPLSIAHAYISEHAYV